MQSLTILNTRDVKRIKDLLIQQFGYALQKDYAYLKNEKNKIYLINKDAARLDWKKLIIDKMGFYFAEDKETEIRLSKEGAQLLAQEAKKNKGKVQNMIELTKEETKAYFQGLDVGKDAGSTSRMVIPSYKNNILGCAKYIKNSPDYNALEGNSNLANSSSQRHSIRGIVDKEGRILNFMPKMYRGEVLV